MDTWLLRPKKANLDSGDAAAKSRGHYAKQHTLQVLRLRNIRVGEMHFCHYFVKYWLG